MENHKMMQDVYQKKAYPPEILLVVSNSGRMGIELANRWMLGWPKRVKALILAGEYLAAFQYQLEREKDSLARASNMSHLVPREIAELYGLSMEPPTID